MPTAVFFLGHDLALTSLVTGGHEGCFGVPYLRSFTFIGMLIASRLTKKT